jgi:hypothetical protein
MLLRTLSFWLVGTAEVTRRSDERVTRVRRKRIVEKAIERN